MIQLFLKFALLIITINAIMMLVTPNQSNTADFPFINQALATDSLDYNSTKIIGETENTTIVEPTTQPSIRKMFQGQEYISVVQLLTNTLFNIVFGYVVWLNYFLPHNLALALIIPLTFIQLFGIFYLLKEIIQVFSWVLGGFLR